MSTRAAQLQTALAGALAADADGLESDVCLAADGGLVLLHDLWLPLGTDLDGWAHERTAAELRGARLCGGGAPLFVDDLLASATRAGTDDVTVRTTPVGRTAVAGGRSGALTPEIVE